jgi:hypothetical protein
MLPGTCSQCTSHACNRSGVDTLQGNSRLVISEKFRPGSNSLLPRLPCRHRCRCCCRSPLPPSSSMCFRLQDAPLPDPATLPLPLPLPGDSGLVGFFGCQQERREELQNGGEDRNGLVGGVGTLGGSGQKMQRRPHRYKEGREPSSRSRSTSAAGGSTSSMGPEVTGWLFG